MKNRRKRTILDVLGVSLEYLTDVIQGNPSLRGVIIGYLAERKLWDWFVNDGRISAIRKDDDHDRQSKGDVIVTYKGFDFRIEVKSLQTNSIKLFDPETGKWIPKVVREARDPKDVQKSLRRKWVESAAYKALWEKDGFRGKYRGQVQCDASDKRTISLPDGTSVTTTNLRVGDFDVLALGLFAFREQWDFGFMLNRDLPRSTHAKYPDAVQEQLIKTLIPVSWPLSKGFVSDSFILLDQLVKERRRRKS